MNTLFKHLVAIVIAIFIGGFSFFANSQSKGKHVSSYSVYGLDISENQSNIDWKRYSKSKIPIKDGVPISFVFVKATKSKGTVEPHFYENWKGLEDLKGKIIRGAYHRYNPDKDPKSQAKKFIETLQELKPGDLPPALDVEDVETRLDILKSDKQKELLTKVKDWLLIVEKQYNIKPIIYYHAKNDTIFNRGDFKKYPSWKAHYIEFNSNEESTRVGDDWDFWQFTQKGDVEGIENDDGYVDIDVFNGSIDKLKELCLSPSFQGGIDVSRYNGKIDWKKVPKTKILDGKNTVAINFAFVKAMDGKTLDRHFYENWKGLEDLKGKIMRGAYHVYNYNSKATPEEQAQNFISNVDLKSGDLPPVLELPVEGEKPDKNNVLQGIKVWLATVENEYGVKPIIFCSDTDYKAYFNTNDFDNYLFWIRCDDNPFQPNNKQLRFWQKKRVEKDVKGINGSVNFNLFNGTLKELKELRLNDD